MLNNLLDVAIPTLPELIWALLGDEIILIMGIIGIIFLAAVIVIFHTLKKKNNANEQKDDNEAQAEKDGEE